MIALIGIGSNLGGREASIAVAVEALKHLPGTKVTGVSSVYETEPVGVEDQPDYLNAVAVLETSLSPAALLGACLGIEAASGRVRSEIPGEKLARVLDLDLLVCGEGEEHIVSSTEELTLPHPRMLERAFVLVPLGELFPEKKALGLDFRKEIEAVADQRILIYRPAERA